MPPVRPGPKTNRPQGPRKPITRKAPHGLPKDVKRAYLALCDVLIGEGLAAEADADLVLLAAERRVAVDSLQEKVAALPSWTMTTRTGERIHPLVVELRVTVAQLAGLLCQLMLSPRARSSSRLGDEGLRPTAGEPSDKERKFFTPRSEQS